MEKHLSRELFEAIAKEAMFGILVYGPNQEFVYCNRMGEQLTGQAEPNLNDLTPPEERSGIKSFSTEFLKHEGLYQDILVRSASGFFIANIGIGHAIAEGTTLSLIMLQDVTLQKKLQREVIAKQAEIKAAFEELLKQNKQLKELDIAKNRFIALTTHELRTPLSAMVASAEILKMEMYDTPEQMKEFIGMIYEQGIHLQDLVNDILDFAKIQAGKMDFYIENLDAKEFSQALLKNYEGMAETSSVSMKFVDPGVECKAYFDSVRLRQVLSNIINNAIKYNRTNGTVTLTIEQDEDNLKILVTDTGKGIPADKLNAVFDEFETIGQVSEHHKGTGLGMPISRKLAEGMGGKLLLKSEVGVGSTFWVEIPKQKILAEELYRPRPDAVMMDLAS